MRHPFWRRMLPSNVADAETIIRVIKDGGFHLTPRRNLKVQAFESPANRDEVSVLRLDYSSADRCKHWGATRVHTATAPYAGLAAFRATAVVDCGSKIVSSPVEGCVEHANIKHGYVRPDPREAGTAEDVEQLRKRLRECFLPRVRFYDDPERASSYWTGAPLVAPA